MRSRCCSRWRAAFRRWTPRRAGHAGPAEVGIELYGKTCGVIGYGAIGRQFARLAAALGMRVIVWTMHPARYTGVEFVGLDELYRTSDAISLHLRLSAETKCFVGAEQFALMKPGAILINTARGAIVDEAALIEALGNGRIAGAGLDVFTVEPLPPQHPLTRLGNVVLTPHCAGITPEALEAGLQMAVDNIWSFWVGQASRPVPDCKGRPEACPHSIHLRSQPRHQPVFSRSSAFQH